MLLATVVGFLDTSSRSMMFGTVRMSKSSGVCIRVAIDVRIGALAEDAPFPEPSEFAGFLTW
jgi:hypothetical protein